MEIPHENEFKICKIERQKEERILYFEWVNLVRTSAHIREVSFCLPSKFCPCSDYSSERGREKKREWKIEGDGERERDK